MCIYPIKKNYSIVDGKIKIDWKSSGTNYQSLNIITLPCGHCNECRKQKSTEWAFRIMLESKLHKNNCMITLTYKETDGELCRRDLQLFIKRLRKKISPLKIKIFYCGEYGSRGGRPHYHLIVFGWRPDDLEKLFFKDGHWVYKSLSLDKIWSLGLTSVVDLTFQSAFYTSLYMQKYNKVNDKKVKPFLGMSTRPAIAKDFASLVDYNVDKIYLDGRQYKVPRYFDKINLDNNLELKEKVKFNRKIKSLLLKKSYQKECEDLEKAFEFEETLLNYSQK